MIRYDDNKDNLDDISCPICGAIGRFKYHASYDRHLINSFGHRVITITRVRCLSCGHTHALIPPDVIPYKVYSESFAIVIFLAYCFHFSLSYVQKRLRVPYSTHKRYLSSSINQVCILFACPFDRHLLYTKVKGYCVSALSNLCREVLGKKFTENVRLNSLVPT